MPAGYTLKRLVSMVRNTSGNFVDFVQNGENYARNAVQVCALSNTQTYNNSLITDGFLPNVKIKSFSVTAQATVAGSLFSVYTGVAPGESMDLGPLGATGERRRLFLLNYDNKITAANASGGAGVLLVNLIEFQILL